MPYPFLPAITFSEFRQRLIKEFGCKYETLEIPGVAQPIRYLERAVGDRKIQRVVTLKENELLLYSVVRSICTHLDIDPALFGLHLG